MQKILALIALGLILLAGNRLREYSYSSVPLPGESADEYSFAWLGMSLIEQRYPVAWSGIGAYKNHEFKRINVDGIYDRDIHRPLFAIDKPWFDHPPLFGLLIGGYAHLKGVRDFEDASVIIIRRPMLKIAWVTTGLIFWLGVKLFGTREGLLAALVYSVSPVMVISSRLVLAENGYIPLFILALIMVCYWRETGRRRYWWLASLAAATAVLFKLSAVAVAVAMVLIALRDGGRLRLRLVAIVLSCVGMAFLMFAIYGWYYDWSTFIEVLRVNSERYYGAGAEMFFQAVTQSRVTKNLTDGWIYLGWVSFFWVSFREWLKKRGGTYLTIAVFSYLAVFLMFGSQNYGWYSFVFYPFLIMATARVMVELFRKPNVAVFTGLMLLPFGTAVHRLINVEGFQEHVGQFRVYILLTLGLLGLSLIESKKMKLVLRVYMILVVSFLVWLSVKEIYFYNVDKWYFAT